MGVDQFSKLCSRFAYASFKINLAHGRLTPFLFLLETRRLLSGRLRAMKALALHTQLAFLFLCFNAALLNVNQAEPSLPQPSSKDEKPTVVADAAEHSTTGVHTPLYRINITSSQGLVGQIEINVTDGTEPVDVVHQFCISHDLPLSKRREILRSICSTIPCHRLRPVLMNKKIYTKPSSGGVPKLVGTVRIIEGQEPADLIRAGHAPGR